MERIAHNDVATLSLVFDVGPQENLDDKRTNPTIDEQEEPLEAFKLVSGDIANDEKKLCL